MRNLLIPMAGEGRRFKEAGYAEDKPFINVLGKPMIQRVVENLIPYDHIVFVSRNNRILDLYPETNIVVDKTTAGALCTCLLSKEYINNDDELVIANSDQVVLDPNYLELGINRFKRDGCDAGIWCFLSTENTHSYATVEDGHILHIAEKVVISPLALVGIHWYRHGRFFVESAEEMIKQNLKSNGEYYLAPSLNLMTGSKIGIHMVNDMLGFGTPDELEESLCRIS